MPKVVNGVEREEIGFACFAGVRDGTEAHRAKDGFLEEGLWVGDVLKNTLIVGCREAIRDRDIVFSQGVAWASLVRNAEEVGSDFFPEAIHDSADRGQRGGVA